MSISAISTFLLETSYLLVILGDLYLEANPRLILPLLALISWTNFNISESFLLSDNTTSFEYLQRHVYVFIYLFLISRKRSCNGAIQIFCHWTNVMTFCWKSITASQAIKIQQELLNIHVLHIHVLVLVSMVKSIKTYD